MVAQNARLAALFHYHDLICSQTNVPSSHIDLSFAGSIRGFSFLIPVGSYSKWPEVISMKSVITCAVINSHHQTFTTH
ncbi:unnamed protein product [Hymenolepis diminuta]|uniref:Uncharacterized protein n=1 Tax=Hymenolepis diminuta TaxID=6216 RepID=A0A564Z6X5_HYMDI|nr:unnamed protein product [Hymenolepis diminuta]